MVFPSTVTGISTASGALPPQAAARIVPTPAMVIISIGILNFLIVIHPLIGLSPRLTPGFPDPTPDPKRAANFLEDL
jgi:hypothetical protein